MYEAKRVSKYEYSKYQPNFANKTQTFWMQVDKQVFFIKLKEMVEFMCKQEGLLVKNVLFTFHDEYVMIEGTRELRVEDLVGIFPVTKKMYVLSCDDRWDKSYNVIAISSNVEKLKAKAIENSGQNSKTVFSYCEETDSYQLEISDYIDYNIEEVEVL